MKIVLGILCGLSSIAFLMCAWVGKTPETYVAFIAVLVFLFGFELED